MSSALLILLIFFAMTVNSDEMLDQELSNTLCSIKLLSGKTCYFTEISDDIPSVEDRGSPFPEDSIFFIETSCNGGLDLRQACSVEAAARANPYREVNVLFVGPVFRHCMAKSTSWEILKYNNVNLYRVNLNEIFKDTPLESIMRNSRQYTDDELSELLKFVVLQKFGGVCLDPDILVVKSLNLLPEQRNWVAKLDYNSLGLAVLALSRHGIGRIVAEKILERYINEIRNDRPLNGTAILIQVLQYVCRAPQVKDMSKAVCGGLEVYDPFYFYPVHFMIWRYFFAPSYYEIPSKPFAFYIWNSLSHNETIYRGSLYHRLVDVRCPRISKSITSTFKKVID